MATLSGPIKDVGIGNLDTRGPVDVTLVPSAKAFVTADGTTHVDTLKGTVTAGVLTVENIPAGVDGLAFQLHINFVALQPGGQSKRRTITSGWFEVTGDLALKDVMDGDLPNTPALTSVSALAAAAAASATDAETAKTDAQAAAVQTAADKQYVHDVSQIDSTDTAMTAVANDESSQFRAAQNAAIAGSIVATDDSLGGWGDSLMAASGDGTGHPWLTDEATALGVAQVNHGAGGTTTTYTAIRCGALPLTLTLGADLPADSGSSVACTVAEQVAMRVGLGFTDNPGVLSTPTGDIPTLLTITVTGTDLAPTFAWTIRRATTAGAATTIPAGSVWRSTVDDDYAKTVHHFMTGQNNLATTDYTNGTGGLPIALRDIDLIARYMAKQGNDRFSIGALLLQNNEFPGSDLRALKESFNRALKTRYGSAVRDWNEWVLGTGLVLSGIVPTPEDWINIHGGTPPVSFRNPLGDGTYDPLHFSQEIGYPLIGMLYRQRDAERGWIAGAKPDGVPISTQTPTVGTVTAHTVTLNWAAAATTQGGPIRAYAVEFRRLGTTKWTYFGASTGTSLTVTGLDSETVYEFALTAYSYAGPGPRAQTATSVTTLSAFTPATLASDTFAGTAGEVNGRTLPNDAGGTLTTTWVVNAAANSVVATNGSGDLVNVGTVWGNVVADAGSSDHVAVITLNGLGPMNVYARYTSTASCYEATVTGNNGLTLSRNGTLTLATLPAGAIAATDTIALEAVGTQVNVYVNGTRKLSVTDPVASGGIATGTKSGFAIPPASVSATIKIASASVTAPRVTVVASDDFAGTRGTAVTGRTLPNDLGGATVLPWTGGNLALDGNGNMYNPTGSAQRAMVAMPVADGKITIGINALPTDSGLVKIMARWTADSSTGVYSVTLTSTGQITLLRGLSGGSNAVLWAPTRSWQVAPGDEIGLGVVGNTLTLMVNGVVYATQTDTNVTGIGTWGIELPAQSAPSISRMMFAKAL